VTDLLTRYRARHDDGCDSLVYVSYPDGPPCSCGLSFAIDSLRWRTEPPTEGGRYECTMDDGGVEVLGYRADIYEWHYLGSMEHCTRVIAWRPLPAPWRDE